MNAPIRRLGRGLESLIAEGGKGSSLTDKVEPMLPDPAPAISGADSEEVETDAGGVGVTENVLQELPLNQVVPNPHQPRKVIDPAAIQELAASIDSEGLLQPIVVRPVENGYELIAGERRWRAHQHLQRSSILARILPANDLSSASLSLIENLQREELNPIEEALGYQSLISDFHLSQQEVSQRMGKSRSHIANLLRLLQLDGELRRLVVDGELSVGHAKALLGIDDPEIRLSIGRKAVLESWTVRQIEEVCKKGSFEKGVIIPKNKESNFYDELAQSTSQSTGRKVKIKASPSGKGSVSFSFKDEADLRSFLLKIEQ
jgi:ParB family chromosome partitioning protein